MAGNGDGLARELDGLAARMGAASRGQRAAYAIKMAVYRRKVRAYRRVLMNEDGQISEAGKIVLADLARIAGLGVARPNRTTEQIHFDEGQRRIVLHMIAHLHLDSDRMARMADRVRENDDD